jgi:hypothetical protein
VTKRKSMKTLRRRIAINNQKFRECAEVLKSDNLNPEEEMKIKNKCDKLNKETLGCIYKIYEQQDYYKLWMESRSNGRR